MSDTVEVKNPDHQSVPPGVESSRVSWGRNYVAGCHDITADTLSCVWLLLIVMKQNAVMRQFDK